MSCQLSRVVLLVAWQQLFTSSSTTAGSMLQYNVFGYMYVQGTLIIKALWSLKKLQNHINDVIGEFIHGCIIYCSLCGLTKGWCVGESNYSSSSVKDNQSHSHPIHIALAKLADKHANSVLYPDPYSMFLVSRIRTRIRHFILMDLDADPSINKQKSKKTLDFYYLVTSFWLFI